MPFIAFSDEQDGYYQIDLAEGDPLPTWAHGMTPTETLPGAEHDPYDLTWTSIRSERDRRVQNGGYFAAGHWFHSDTFSRTQQLGLVLLGANIPVGLQWKTMDDGFVTMTQTLAGQIFAAAAASDQAHFLAAEVHNAAMRASPEPHLYDYSTGWPPIFEA